MFNESTEQRIQMHKLSIPTVPDVECYDVSCIQIAILSIFIFIVRMSSAFMCAMIDRCCRL